MGSNWWVNHRPFSVALLQRGEKWSTVLETLVTLIKKISFLDRELLSAIFIVFTKCPTLSISSLLCPGMALSREWSLCVQSLLVLREVSYSLEVLKSLEEANNEANITFLRVFNIWTFKNIDHLPMLLSTSFSSSAAHCVTSKQSDIIPLSQLDIFAGLLDIRKFNDSHVQRRRVIKIINHRDFNFTLFESDLALLKLDREIKISDYVRPVCLPEKPE